MSRRSRAEVVMAHHDGPGAKSGPEARLKSVFLEAPLGIELYDPRDGLLDANPARLEPFGVDSVEDLLHPSAARRGGALRRRLALSLRRAAHRSPELGSGPHLEVGRGGAACRRG